MKELKIYYSFIENGEDEWYVNDFIIARNPEEAYSYLQKIRNEKIMYIPKNNEEDDIKF